MINPVKRAGVKGGDILDKMTHEIYVIDFIEALGQNINMKLEEAESKYFLPFRPNSDHFMTIEGGKTLSINNKTATGMTKAKFDTGKTKISLNASWIGLSDEAIEIAEKHRKITNGKLLKNKVVEENGKLITYEEARFFLIKGSKNLLGDMLNKKIYDLDKQKQLETPKKLHDQLYRVIEKAILRAADKKEPELTETEIDVFMNSLFNIKDKITSKKYKTYEELEKARQRVKKLIEDPSKIKRVQEKAKT